MMGSIAAAWNACPRLLRQGCCWLGVAAASLTGLRHIDAAEQIYTSSTRFRIPFQFDPVELRRLQATEIQLFVSSDTGKSWQRVASVSPTDGRFSFVASGDGSYLFSVKTAVLGGQLIPPGPHVSGLNVVVDTQPPVIQLSMRELEAGKALVEWRIADDHPKADTLVVEFQHDGDTVWKPLSVDPQTHGQTTWPVAVDGRVQVRATVSDAAGNKSTAETSGIVSAGGPALPPPLDMGSDDDVPVAQDPVLPRQPEAGIASKPPGDVPIPFTTADLPAPLVQSFNPELKPAETGAASSKSNRSLTENSEVIGRIEGPRIPTHSVNGTTFRVGYEFENVGPSGVGNVELYITENNGEEWFHYGTDPDKTSPFVVTVPGEGDYGFSFRISNGVGFVSDPPQPGEGPEVAVTVDMTPPAGSLHSMQQPNNQILIAWTAQDRALKGRTATLLYGLSPNGPWERIVENQESASGRYLWNVPKSLDRQVYLRVEVRDMAGNLAAIHAEKPLPLDRTQPRARVIGIESIRPTEPSQY